MIQRVSTHLEIEWYAHDVHPWDADLPDDRQARLFVDSALSQTLSAIRRAFERFPEVDSIAVRVLDPRDPTGVLLRGAVSRRDLDAATAIKSDAMSLKLLGVEFQLVDSDLQPLR
jgi:hypothetical protein